MAQALILVDIQVDFLPGGALAVPDGDAILAPVLALIDSGRFDTIVATQDWHPAGHESFASVHGKPIGTVVDLHGLPQVLWPDHCVQGTPGAAFAPTLPVDRIDAVFQKGTHLQTDSYSGFFDNGHRHNTGLADWLRLRGVTEVTVVGLATDYCVKWTALDALREGFSVRLVREGCRGVDLSPGDVAAALAELRNSGVTVE